jgi:hypothetical protein
LTKTTREKGSGGFRDFARLDAGCADFHPVRATLGLLHANRLQVRIKASLSAIVRVRDIVAELWSFTADFATFGHDYFNLQISKTKFYSKRISKSSSRVPRFLWGSQLKEQS